jgi:VanZ family protein
MSATRERANRSFFRTWLPLLLWAAVIFVFSTDTFSSANTAGALEPILRSFFPNLTADDIERIHAVIRKLGHFSEYFIFACLLMRALGAGSNALTHSRQLRLTIIITLAYAITDELHQVLVPSRTPSGFDVLIDAFGGICGSWSCHFLKSAGSALVATAPKKT